MPESSLDERLNWLPDDIVIDRRAQPQESSSSATASTHTTASDIPTGAMIALMPAAEDAERLALDAPGAEPPAELHLTLFFLGQAADWDEEHRADLVQRLTDRAQDLLPLAGQVFGANQWNANGEEPCWVWSVGDDRERPLDAPTLETARWAATYALEDMHRQPQLPAQHSPWQPHVCAAYSRSPALLTMMNERLGAVRFDRLRVAFAGEHIDIPLGPPTPQDAMGNDEHDQAQGLTARRWSTPGDTALAFENEQTGDGRVFRAGALYWDGGPWPLQYADEMLMGHQGAELAGAIEVLERDAYRLASNGVLYPGRPAGADALMLLEEGAPLGVSVDLDDVTVEFVDANGQTVAEPDDEVVLLAAALPSASVLRLDDGSWAVTAAATEAWTASGQVMSRTAAGSQLITGPDGRIPAAAVRAAFGSTGTLTAGAGDPDPEDGIVLHSESAGDLLMRITRARVRGATLVAMPAYASARIVLDDLPQAGEETAPAATAAAGPTDAHLRVVDYVRTSPVPIGARDVARALDITMVSARGHLARAATAGRLVRLARGLYVGAPTLPEGGDVTAAVSGDVDLPVHADRDAEWDGDAAASRVRDWATGDDGQVDAERLARAFLWRDDDADPATLAAYKLGFADVVDNELQVIAGGVYAVGAALQGARGGVNLPDDVQGDIRDRAEDLYERLADTYDDPSITAPWERPDDDDDDGGMEAILAASAWTAMRDVDPLPAAWFREPTQTELPPGSGGVHYARGRIYGWVAQAGEPHAGHPGKNLTIESLGELDLTHFLRARFALDDGTQVRAGAMTMNAPHHRDGAECESASCQFDDTRTVAGVVTVGMNERGLWFSGAAAPWLSEWDRAVFQACQPSYHMKRGPAGRWQLRAVLSVPVPGHSSPLVATAVERSNLALAASAAVHEQQPDSDDADPLRAEIDDLRRRVDVDGDVPDPVDVSTAAVVVPDSPAALYPTPPTPPTLDPAFVDAVAAAVTARLNLPAPPATASRTEEEPPAGDQRAEIARLEAIVASAAPTAPSTPSTEEAP